MRLWSYQILDVLPDKFIIAEWRECIAIKRQWEKGTLKHRLVSYIMDYDKNYFLHYTLRVVTELKIRKIKYQEKYWTEIRDFCVKYGTPITSLYYPEHNDRYLKQCLYNLEEKFDRKIITEEEWKKIHDKFKDFTNLWEGEYHE